MFTLTLVDVEYETSVSIWELEMMIALKLNFLPSFQLATRLNSQNTMKLNLLMNTDTLICL